MKPSWRVTLGVLACVVGAVIATYWSTAVEMVGQWRTSTYSHQVLVVPLALYLAWRRRKQLAAIEPKPSVWALLFVPLAAFGWLLGDLTVTDVVQQFCLLALIVVLILGITGWEAARILAAPLVFLFFAVPAGDALIPLLQDYSAWSAVKLLDLTRVPVLLEGRLITIPSGKWEVAEACSGIHYLLAMVTIGFVYADVMYRKLSRKAIFLAACIVTPIVANGIRVYGILLTDYLGGTNLARSTDHIIAGGIFLTLITILLFVAGMRWRENRVEYVPPGAVARANAASGQTAQGFTKPTLKLLVFASLAFAVAAAAPVVARSAGKQATASAVNLRAPTVTLPWVPNGYSAGTEFTGWRWPLSPADAQLAQGYAKQGRAVSLFVLYYGPTDKSGKLVSSASSPYSTAGWLSTGERNVTAKVDGQPLQVREISISSAGRRLVLWRWYWVDGRFTSSDYRAKMFLAWARLKTRSKGSAQIIAVTEDSPTGDEPAESLLRDFTEHLSLSAQLDGAAAGNSALLQRP